MKKYMVFNVTDGVFVTWNPVPSKKADEIIKTFPDRYKDQGYYRNNRMEKMDPSDVILEKQLFTE